MYSTTFRLPEQVAFAKENVKVSDNAEEKKEATKEEYKKEVNDPSLAKRAKNE